jgi:hypothetical protein
LHTASQQLAARGGPSLWEVRWAMDTQRLTWYPLAAVLAVLEYEGGWSALEEDWRRVCHRVGHLPWHLSPTEDGHYTALLPERVVVEELLWLSEAPVVQAYQEALEAARVRSYPPDFAGEEGPHV